MMEKSLMLEKTHDHSMSCNFLMMEKSLMLEDPWSLSKLQLSDDGKESNVRKTHDHSEGCNFRMMEKSLMLEKTHDHSISCSFMMMKKSLMLEDPWSLSKLQLYDDGKESNVRRPMITQ